MKITELTELWALVDFNGETYTRPTPCLWIKHKDARAAADELNRTAGFGFKPIKLAVGIDPDHSPEGATA